MRFRATWTFACPHVGGESRVLAVMTNYGSPILKSGLRWGLVWGLSWTIGSHPAPGSRRTGCRAWWGGSRYRRVYETGPGRPGTMGR